MITPDSTNSSVLNLSYSIDDIAKEVEMRTSYLGRFRKTQESAHLLDMLAFTKDERDLFISFIKSGMALIFSKISKLTKNLTDAYELDLDPNSNNTYANKVHYKVEWTDNMNPNYKQPLDQRIFDCLCWYVIYRWLMMVMPSDDDKTAATGYSSALEDIQSYSSKMINPYVYKTPRVF